MNTSAKHNQQTTFAASLPRRRLGGFAAGALLTLGVGHAAIAQDGKRRSRFFEDNEVRFVTAWGSRGAGNGQFIDPHGIAVDRRDNVYVVDAGTHQVQRFTRNGGFVKTWGSRGRGNGQFIGPQFIAADNRRDDVVYVADFGNDRDQKFTNGGQFLTGWGTTGAGNGQFNGPVGIGVDNNGFVYVVDQGNCRIQASTATGNS